MQLPLLRLPAQLKPAELPCSSSSHVVDKSESGDYVALNRHGVVRGSVVGRVESALITRVANPFDMPRGILGRMVARNEMGTREQVP